jgi:hypothetical protein
MPSRDVYSLIDSSRTGQTRQQFAAFCIIVSALMACSLYGSVNSFGCRVGFFFKAAKDGTEKRRSWALSLMQQPGDVAFKLLTFLNSFVS